VELTAGRMSLTSPARMDRQSGNLGREEGKGDVGRLKKSGWEVGGG